MDNYEEKKITINIPKKQKGLVFKIAVDGHNAGLYLSISKYRIELCLFYIAFRLYFMSEEKYNAILTTSILAINNCPHKVFLIRK